VGGIDKKTLKLKMLLKKSGFLYRFDSKLFEKTATVDNASRIQISGENPRYWQYKGETVLLIGGSREDNLFNHPARNTGLGPLDCPGPAEALKFLR